MPGTQFQTTVPTMQQAAGHVADVHGQLASMLSAYWNRQQPIIAASAWKGAGQTSFAALAAEWNQGFTAINEALDAIGQQIRGSGQTYDTSDTSTSSDFSGLQGSTSLLGSVR